MKKTSKSLIMTPQDTPEARIESEQDLLHLLKMAKSADWMRFGQIHGKAKRLINGGADLALKNEEGLNALALSIQMSDRDLFYLIAKKDRESQYQIFKDADFNAMGIERMLSEGFDASLMDNARSYFIAREASLTIVPDEVAVEAPKQRMF